MVDENPNLEKYFGVWSNEKAEKVLEEVENLRREFNRDIRKRQEEIARKFEDINLSD
jgi:hypothetical protein